MCLRVCSLLHVGKQSLHSWVIKRDPLLFDSVSSADTDASVGGWIKAGPLRQWIIHAFLHFFISRKCKENVNVNVNLMLCFPFLNLNFSSFSHDAARLVWLRCKTVVLGNVLKSYHEDVTVTAWCFFWYWSMMTQLMTRPAFGCETLVKHDNGGLETDFSPAHSSS